MRKMRKGDEVHFEDKNNKSIVLKMIIDVDDRIPIEICSAIGDELMRLQNRSGRTLPFRPMDIQFSVAITMIPW